MVSTPSRTSSSMFLNSPFSSPCSSPRSSPSFIPSLENRKNDIHDILYNESETHKIFPELIDCNYRELTKILHVEIFEIIFDKPVAVIFYYDKRDPLTNNCVVTEIPLFIT